MIFEEKKKIYLKEKRNQKKIDCIIFLLETKIYDIGDLRKK